MNKYKQVAWSIPERLLIFRQGFITPAEMRQSCAPLHVSNCQISVQAFRSEEFVICVQSVLVSVADVQSFTEPKQRFCITAFAGFFVFLDRTNMISPQVLELRQLLPHLRSRAGILIEHVLVAFDGLIVAARSAQPRTQVQLQS
jgi:hypothetical protein